MNQQKVQPEEKSPRFSNPPTPAEENPFLNINSEVVSNRVERPTIGIWTPGHSSYKKKAESIFSPTESFKKNTYDTSCDVSVHSVNSIDSCILKPQQGSKDILSPVSSIFLNSFHSKSSNSTVASSTIRRKASARGPMKPYVRSLDSSK